jgi:aspartate aminotransferase
MNLSQRILNIEESRTTAFTGLIRQLRQQGRQIINLAVGEPEEDPLPEIIQATKAALDAGRTRYGPVPGEPELRAGVAAQYDGYGQQNILISNGSKQALFLIFQVICNPQDEVIISRPYWVTFPEQVKLAGARPVFVDTRDHQLDIEQIKRAISPRTRAILINSPNNPTGAVYSRSDLEQLVRLAAEHDLYLVSDEAYHAFVYDSLRPASLYEFQEARDRLIITGSFSKTYAMTGFRIGYAAAHSELIQAMTTLQGHMSGNVCTPVQYGALAALRQDPRRLAAGIGDLQGKRDMAYGWASKTFRCVKPQGAFYLFPDVSQHLTNGMTSADFAARVLREAGVAVVPGEAFGSAGHIRISFAVSEDNLRSGLDRIAEVL